MLKKIKKGEFTMHNGFRDGSQVIVNGSGKNNGKYYDNQLAIVLERDPYFLDYHVRFEDGTDDWLSPRYLQKPILEGKEIKENEI